MSAPDEGPSGARDLPQSPRAVALTALLLTLIALLGLSSCAGSGSDSAESLIERAGDDVGGNGGAGDQSETQVLGKDASPADNEGTADGLDDPETTSADDGQDPDVSSPLAAVDGDGDVEDGDVGTDLSDGGEDGQSDPGNGDRGAEDGPEDEEIPLVAEPVAIALDPGLTPQEAIVQAVSGDAIAVENGDPCRSLTRPDVVIRCGLAGPLAWEVVVPATGAGTTVTIYRVIGGAEPTELEPVLEAVDEFGRAWESVGIQAVDLSGDKVPEVLIGFRSSGSGNFLDIDVIANDGQVVVHRSLHHGEAVFYSGVYADYAAVANEDEPNCCPSEFSFETLGYTEGRWTVSDATVVDADQVLSGLF